MMFFLVSVAGTSSYFGMRNLHPLKVSFLSHERFFAGKEAHFALMLENQASYGVYDLNISYEDSHNYVKSLKPQSSQQIELSTRFIKRGRSSFSSLHIESLFPLIHERKFRDILLSKELVIYATPEGVSLLHSLHLQENLQGDMSDFLGLEEFVAGESLSRVHWASLAKNETLMKKIFSYEEEQKELHFCYEKLEGSKESRLSQLTLWVLECEALGFVFTLLLGEKLFESKKEHIDEILRQIALL